MDFPHFISNELARMKLKEKELIKRRDILLYKINRAENEVIKAGYRDLLAPVLFEIDDIGDAIENAGRVGIAWDDSSSSDFFASEDTTSSSDSDFVRFRRNYQMR